MSLLNHPRQGETMTTAAMVTYAYDQIDQARAELTAVSKNLGCLALPVVGAVVSGVGAGGVLHDDGITGAEVVEEPPCVGGADVDAAVTDVALALVIHRPWCAVYKVATVIEPDG